MTRSLSYLMFAGALLLMSLPLMAQDRDPNRPPAQQGDPNVKSQSGPELGSQPGAQDRTGTNQQVTDEFSRQLTEIQRDPNTACDKMFVLMASMGNQCEMELARIAQQKATNDQVKQLAQKILDDHRQAQEKLARVAQKLGITPMETLPPVKQQELQILSSLPTDRFEKEFVVLNQANHAAAITMYRAEQALAQDADVKQYAADCLPKLRDHAHSIHQAAVALGLPVGERVASVNDDK